MSSLTKSKWVSSMGNHSNSGMQIGSDGTLERSIICIISAIVLVIILFLVRCYKKHKARLAAINAPVELQHAAGDAHVNTDAFAEGVDAANERQEAIDLRGRGHVNSLPPTSPIVSSDETGPSGGRRGGRGGSSRGGLRGGHFAMSAPEAPFRSGLSKRMYHISLRRATSPKPSHETHFVAQDALAQLAPTCLEAPPKEVSTHPCHTHMESVFKDVVQSLQQTEKLVKIMDAVVNHHNVQDRHPFQAAFNIQPILEPTQVEHIHKLIMAKVGTGLYDCYQTYQLI